MYQVARDAAPSRPPAELTELLEVIKRVQTAKNPDDFEKLYKYYQAPLGRRLLYLVGDRDTALELYQDTFYKLWKSLPLGEAIHHFEAWLYQCAKNLAIDYLRKKTKITFVSLPQHEPEEPEAYVTYGRLSVAGPEGHICEMECLKQALATMSPQCRVCVLLQDLWGCSQREIASQLGITEKTVSANVSRGRAQLREAYGRLMEELRIEKGGQRA